MAVDGPIISAKRYTAHEVKLNMQEAYEAIRKSVGAPYGARVHFGDVHVFINWNTDEKDIRDELLAERTRLDTPHHDAELTNVRIEKSFRNDTAVGNVYNDKKGRFKDGALIRTTAIIGQSGDTIQTRNSRYLILSREPKTCPSS